MQRDPNRYVERRSLRRPSLELLDEGRLMLLPGSEEVWVSSWGSRVSMHEALDEISARL